MKIEFDRPIKIVIDYDASKVTDKDKLGVYNFNEEENKQTFTCASLPAGCAACGIPGRACPPSGGA